MIKKFTSKIDDLVPSHEYNYDSDSEEKNFVPREYFIEDEDFKLFIDEYGYYEDTFEGYYFTYNLSKYNLEVNGKKLKKYYRIFCTEHHGLTSEELYREYIFRFDDDSVERFISDTNGIPICNHGGKGDIFSSGAEIREVSFKKLYKIKTFDIVGINHNKLIIAVPLRGDQPKYVGPYLDILLEHKQNQERIYCAGKLANKIKYFLAGGVPNYEDKLGFLIVDN